MATSTNPTIQKLMNEAESLAANDPDIMEKLNMIAQKVAEEQQKVKAALTGAVDDRALVDPSDAFACEGCQ